MAGAMGSRCAVGPCPAMKASEKPCPCASAIATLGLSPVAQGVRRRIAQPTRTAMPISRATRSRVRPDPIKDRDGGAINSLRIGLWPLRSACLGQSPLDPLVRNQPHRSDGDVKADRDPWFEEGGEHC